MGLKIITQPDRPHGKTISFDANGFPVGPGVEYFPCDNCDGSGVDYPDAESARECPRCQGYGKLPYARRGCTW